MLSFSQCSEGRVGKEEEGRQPTGEAECMHVFTANLGELRRLGSSL